MRLPQAELVEVAAIIAPVLRSLGTTTIDGVSVSDFTLDGIRSSLEALSDEDVRTFLRNFASNPIIFRALTRLSAPPITISQSSPRQRSRYVNGRPIVDREVLHSHLANMVTGSKRVLFIRGPRWSGKTYSRFIIQDEIQSLGHQLADIDLVGTFALEAVLHQVESWIPLRSAMPTFASNHAAEENWARACAQHVFTSANATPVWWLVFDHYDQYARTMAMISFFLRLVELAATHRVATSMRLVLIDRMEPAPLVARHNTVEEDILLPERADLEAFYRSTTDWDDSRIRFKVDGILADLKAVDQADWMATLEVKIA